MTFSDLGHIVRLLGWGRVLARHVTEVETSFGRVRVKYNEQGNFAPEYEDCRQAATAKGVPLRTVIGEANQIFLSHWKSNHSQ